MADYPLPDDTVQVYRQAGRYCRNPGLLFDRYTAYRPGWRLESSSQTQSNPKYESLEVVRDTQMNGDLHEAYVTRWRTMLAAQDAETFEAEPEWRFVVGLGQKGPLEVGMTFHRIYGFPIIPGSSLKGLARAYAEVVDEASEEEITCVFGNAPGAGEGHSEARVGRAVFFDAVPVVPPRLEIDVMNPHYAEYYSQKKDSRGDPIPPADYLPPTPIYFLTVSRGSRYLFGIAGPEKDQARTWLEGGLSELGSGAKTTSGYGYWEKAVEEEDARSNAIVSAPQIAEPVIPPGYQRGRVKVFGLGRNRSFGFIYPRAGGAEVFVHRDNLAEGVTTLEENQEVIFKLVETPEGEQAEDVRPLS